MRDTSRLAHDSLDKLSAENRAIQAVLQLGGGYVSRRKIAEQMNQDTGWTAARCNALLKKLILVEESTKTRDPETGRLIFKVKIRR